MAPSLSEGFVRFCKELPRGGSLPRRKPGSALSLGKLAAFSAFGGWRLGFGCDGYLDVSTFFELRFVAVLVR